MGVIVNKIIPVKTGDLVLTDGTQGINYSKIGSYDDTIFRILNRISANSLLDNPGIITTELDLFLQYAEQLALAEPVPVGFTEINNYLGSIGV